PEYLFFSSRRRHTRLQGDWSSDVCSSDLRPGRAKYNSARLSFNRPGHPREVELNGKIYGLHCRSWLRQNHAMNETRDTTGNPAPLGLLGFGMTTVLLNFHNAGFYELNAMILAMGICYGG